MNDGHVCSVDILEGPTLESEKQGSMDEHGSFILDEPQDPCSHKNPLESINCCVNGAYKSYNHSKL